MIQFRTRLRLILFSFEHGYVSNYILMSMQRA